MALLDDYDLSKFLRDHPGGVNTLNGYKGKNILQAMAKYDHSVSAYHMLHDLKFNDSNLTGKVSENGRIITKEEDSLDVKEIAFLEELEVWKKSNRYLDFVLSPTDIEKFLKEAPDSQYVATKSRLDWTKPLLSQLDAIAPHYDKWVNCAVYRKCKLFTSPLLESLTYTPWYMVPLVWIPIILYLGYWQVTEHVRCGESCAISLTPLQYLYHIAIGLIIWSALEYSLHRWVFHLDPGSSPTMIKLHFLIHGMHHKVPFDGLRQVFPPVPAFFIVCIIYVHVHAFLTYPLIKLTGGLIGYLTYDMIHYYVHHGSPEDGSYLYAMKRYHSNHHFINHDKAFGISSSFWDHVFKTFVRVKKLGFSLRWS